MLKMKEMVLLIIISALIAVLTGSLIRGSWTYEVELIASPSGPKVSVPEGVDFNITCQVSGGDKRKVTSMNWLNSKGNIITEGNPSVIEDRTNSLLLTFTKPKKTEDSGTYKCEASYDNEYHLHYTVNIVFYGPAPEFENPFENRTVIEGERVEAYCYATGEKPMTYTWYNQNSDKIPEDPGHDIYVSTSENGSTLIIESIRFNHEGMYTCSAENSHGLLSKLFHLGVSPKTGNNTDNDDILDVKILSVSSNSVQLRIAVKGSAKYIEVKYRESRNNTEYSRTIPIAPDNIYNITDLLPGGLYSFQFRISEGSSTWSKTFQVTMLPDAPEIIFRKMEKGSIQFEWFVKVDDRMRGTIDKYEITYYSVMQQSGEYWIPSDCATTIQLPSCRGSQYIISGLSENVYYQIEVRSHTAAGFGEASKQKIFLPR